MRNVPWSLLTWMELIDSREITITVSDDGDFMPTFTGTVGVPKRNVSYQNCQVLKDIVM
jgi:hypothetical protein